MDENRLPFFNNMVHIKNIIIRVKDIINNSKLTVKSNAIFAYAAE